MKFFIPDAANDSEAEEIYDATRKFARQTLGWPVSERRIRSIIFRDQNKIVKAEVGHTDPVTGEKVIAILDSTTFLVCTANRGVSRGMPVLVGKHEVSEEAVFE
jgi:hypothetical protein